MIKPEITEEELKDIREYLEKIDNKNIFKNTNYLLKEYFEYKENQKERNLKYSQSVSNKESKNDDDKEKLNRHRV